MRYVLPVLPVVAVAVVGLSPAAAGWSATGSGQATTGADVMSNASGFTAACTTKNGNSTVTLRWTPSPDPYVTGYTIVRRSTSGTSVTRLVTGGTTATYTDAVGSSTTQTLTYTIEATSSTTLWRTTPVAAGGQPSYTRSSCQTLA